MMRSANPALSAKTFTGFGGSYAQAEQTMSLQGTVNKTGILLLLAFLTAAYVWNMAASGNMAGVYPLMIGGAIGGLVMAIVTAFMKKAAGITAPIYALLEGLFLGGISSYFEMRFPGIVMQATALTFGTMFALLIAYKSGVIKATENFKLGVAAATGAIFLAYMASFIMGIFGFNMPFLHDAGPIGIVVSLVIVVVAALNLVLDFDFIETGCERGAPKYMEWYAAFGLVVTLVWLYVEMLRLLSKLNRN
jgi:uncharacterized YccA/Bax inhibitor family protein